MARMASAPDLPGWRNYLPAVTGPGKVSVVTVPSSGGRSALVCSFRACGVEIEVFAENVPATRQNGYLHMITEYELLRTCGSRLRDRVMELKLAGLKTEPAFAVALDLPGDPYEAILSKGRELGLF